MTQPSRSCRRCALCTASILPLAEVQEQAGVVYQGRRQAPAEEAMGGEIALTVLTTVGMVLAPETPTHT